MSTFTDVWTGVKKSTGLQDGVYDNLVQNASGVAVLVAAGAGLASYFVGSNIKNNTSKEVYAEARDSVNPVLRVTMPSVPAEGK
jgi:hypothetical protein